MGTEDARGGGAMAKESMKKLVGHATGVGPVRHACFLWEGILLEPFEKWAAEAADDAHLGKVHMSIDKARQDEAIAAVENYGIGRSGLEGGKSTDGSNAAILHEESSVGLDTKGIGFPKGVGAEIEQRSPDQFRRRLHYL